MKHDIPKTGYFRIFHISILVPVFLFLPLQALPQTIQYPDSIMQNPPGVPVMNTGHIRLLLLDPGPRLPDTLIPLSGLRYDRTMIFLDSLKSRAAKTLVTRKLYDFLVIQPHSPSGRTISSTSEFNYVIHSGKRIRSIKIRELSVFGSDINNPEVFAPNGLERLLNSTHINTSERIIRKNLLFTPGDTISPIQLSDNERLLRDLPFIAVARIMVIPVSDNEADIMVLTKDIYSLGASANIGSLKKGTVSVFEKNIFGIGHEFRVEVPYDSRYAESPGIGIQYLANNINRSFINLGVYYYDGPGKKTYGFDLGRRFVSSTTKYAGGISLRQMSTTEDLDSLTIPAPVKYNLQDYWLSRSFLIDPENVVRLVIGGRYTNNNVFDRPFILPDSYRNLQKYRIILGSMMLSVQKYYKTNLIYSYGRTEDVPYGVLADITAGWETSEFKNRLYMGTGFSFGQSVNKLGYFYGSAGFSVFLNNSQTEQGMVMLRTRYISNLLYAGRSRVRNFVNIDYTRGFDRYYDEFLVFNRENGFSGFRNDSIGGTQRLSFNLESVVFSPVSFYGFKFAFFGFADFGFLFGTNETPASGDFLSAIGLGIRIRNENMVFNTFQMRLAFFPNPPDYSRLNNLLITGEQLLRPRNFEPDIPSLLPYK